MNTQEACAYLGTPDAPISKRTLQRYAEKGLLSVTYLPGTGTRSIADYNKDELDKLKENQQHSEEKRDDAPAPDALVARRDAAPGAALLELLTNLQSPKRPPVSLSDKLLLSIPEAHELTGISQEALRAAVRENKLKGKTIPGHRGIAIKRDDLNAYVKKL